jgi:hypothetical protein
MNNKQVCIKYRNGKGQITERLVENLELSFQKYNNIEQWVLKAFDCRLNLHIIVSLKGVTFL